MRLIFRELTHSLGGFQFPDIVWVFKCGVKVILYCKTIDLCLRVALYGWSLHPVIRALDNVRLWTSLTSQEYNARTLSLFEDNADTSVIVATIAFGMGMNIRNVTDSVNLGLPDTLATLHQQNGRAGRNFSIEARGWTYIESSILAAVRDELETGKVTKSASKTKKAHKQPLSTVPLPAQDIAEPVVATLSKGKVKLEDLEDSLRLCLVAFVASECLYATINPLLGNSDPKSKLRCREARRPLPCSNCDLLWLDLYPYLACTTPTPSTLLPTPALTPITASTPSASTTPGLDAPAPKPYPKYVQENAALWLNDLAQRRWGLQTSVTARFLPYPMYWAGTSVSSICEHLHLLNSRPFFDKHLGGWKYLQSDGDVLFSFIMTELDRFNKHAQKVKESKTKKSAITRAKNKGRCLILSRSTYS